MGKGTRNRNVRAEDKVAAPSKQVQKKNKSVFYGTIGMAVFAVVLVVFLVFNALTGAGVFLRGSTAAESDDFEVDGAMMSYFIYTTYNDYVQYYQEYYETYFGSYMQSNGLSVYSLIGIDPNTSLKKQVMDTKTGQTWFQYFADQATTEVKRLLVICQAAKAAGVAVKVIGFADVVGASDYNVKLSQSRAEAVAKVLKENGADVVTVIGYGESDEYKERFLNRRVVITVAEQSLQK
jgi:hypothetical protein